MTTRSQTNELMQTLQREEETLAQEREEILADTLLALQDTVRSMQDEMRSWQETVQALQDEMETRTPSWLLIAYHEKIRQAAITKTRIKTKDVKMADGRWGKTHILEICLDRIWTPCHQPYATAIMKLADYPDDEINFIDVTYDLETDEQMAKRLDAEKKGSREADKFKSLANLPYGSSLPILQDATKSPPPPPAEITTLEVAPAVRKAKKRSAR